MGGKEIKHGTVKGRVITLNKMGKERLSGWKKKCDIDMM